MVHRRRLLPLRHRHDRGLHRVRADRVRRLVPLVSRPPRAVPFLDRRLYFLIIMFVPSILFWPSSIGKEALMQFAIGSAALGTAHIFNGKIVRGLLVALPGAWLMSVVRAHLLGLVALAAAGGLRDRAGARAGHKRRRATSSLVKPLGIVIVVFIAVFAVSAGANSLGPAVVVARLGASRARRDQREHRQRQRELRQRRQLALAVEITRRAWSRCCCGRSRGRSVARSRSSRHSRASRSRRSSSGGASRSRSRCDIYARFRSCSIAGCSRSSTR